MPIKHLVIPDTQVGPGRDTRHIEALANYTVEKKPDRIIMLGDWWDMASLSSYETRGSKYFHDKTYKADVDSGNAAMRLFLAPIQEERWRRIRQKKKQWNPEMHFLLGNHEDRIQRAVWEDPRLEGVIGYQDLYLDDWIVHPFLDIVSVDGVAYSHYFINPDSLKGNPVSGTIENKLKLLGHSFTMGHQQKRQYGTRFTGTGRELHGLVCGAFYIHDEEYLGPQKNRQYWRGVVVKHEVNDGSYDIMFVSADYLLREYL